jgi:hypothetical protein
VDRLYRKEPFQSDRERVEHLFALYGGGQLSGKRARRSLDFR